MLVHALGGSRQIATLLTELKRTDKKLGVVSMCIGSPPNDLTCLC